MNTIGIQLPDNLENITTIPDSSSNMETNIQDYYDLFENKSLDELRIMYEPASDSFLDDLRYANQSKSKLSNNNDLTSDGEQMIQGILFFINLLLIACGITSNFSTGFTRVRTRYWYSSTFGLGLRYSMGKSDGLEYSDFRPIEKRMEYSGTFSKNQKVHVF